MSKRLQVIHEGQLDLVGFKIPCYVLEDGTRVLSSRGMQDALKLVDEQAPPSGQKPGTRMARLFGYTTLKEFIFKDKDLDHFKPIECYNGNQKISGYEATVLADICEAMLDARRAGVHLTVRQRLIADQAEMLMRGFARIGIISLVDEATGYQSIREKDALQEILRLYVSEDILKWQLTFKETFYMQIFRLKGWSYSATGIRKRPGIVGRYTNDYIYAAMPPGVMERIKEQTPKGKSEKFKYRFFQSLTPEIGREKLKEQILMVTTLMGASRSWQQFQMLFANMFGGQLKLDLGFDDTPNTPAKPKNDFDQNLKGLLNVPPPPKDDKGEMDDEEPETPPEPKPKKPKK